MIKWLLISSILLLVLMVMAAGVATVGLVMLKKSGKLDTWIDQETQSHILYQSAHIRWHFNSPRLMFNNMSVTPLDQTKPLLHVDRLIVDFSLLDSLRAHMVVTDKIIVSGTTLNVVQNSDGSFTVNDFHSKDSSPTAWPTLARYLGMQRHVLLEKTTLSVHLQKERPFVFQQLNVNWQKQGHRGYAYALSFDTPNIPSGDCNVQGTVEGDIALPDTLAIEATGTLSGEDFTPLLTNITPDHVHWLNGGGNVEFQLHYAKGFKNIMAFVALHDLKLAVAHPLQQLSLPKLVARLNWQSEENGGWLLKIVDANSKLSIEKESAAQNNFSVIGHNIDIALLSQCVAIFLSPEGAFFKALHGGLLNGLITTLTLHQSANGAGELNTTLTNVRLSPSAMFPNGWPAFNGELALRWQKEAHFFDLKITQGLLQNNWLRLLGTGNITVDINKLDNPNVDLQGTLTAHQLDQVRTFYIPHQVVPEALSDWLNQGLVGLPTVTGTFAWKGQWQEMPYANHQGHFSIILNTDNASVIPWPQWPAITHLNANVIFNNNALTVHANNAATLDNAIQTIDLNLNDLRPRHPKKLLITGRATTSGDALLQYLAHMPILSKKYRDNVTHFHLGHSTDLDLKLVFPFAIPSKSNEVNGMLTFHGVTLSSKTGTVLLSNLVGPLHFDQSHFFSAGLSAFIADQTVNFSMPSAPFAAPQFLLKTVHALGQDFNAIHLSVMNKEEHALLVYIDSDALQGHVTIPQTPGPWQIDFDLLSLMLDTHGLTKSNTNIAKILSSLPPLEIVIKKLQLNHQTLGTLKANTAPTKNGLMLNRFSLSGDDLDLLLNGDLYALSNSDHIDLEAHLHAINLGNVLSAMAYPNVLNKGQGDINVSLHFDGHLFSPLMNTLNGLLSFDLKEGKFLKYDAGLLRLFGLFSIDTILSSLQLNFKSMLAEGLSFDTLTGTYVINHGVATTSNLVMTGPSVNLSGTGSINFEQKTIDQTLTIMPELSGGLAVAATLIGGPIAGAATWLADKLLDNTLFKAVHFRYHVTGPWDKLSMTKEV